MGRLFQYNRFGEEESTDSKKDIKTNRNNGRYKEVPSPTSNSHRTNNKYKTLPCPAYSELYLDYKQPTAATTTTTPATIATTNEPTSTITTTKSSEQEMTTSTFMSSSTTLKSVELAIKKYQQWSNKFLTNSLVVAEQPTTTTTTATSKIPARAAETSEDNRQSSTSTSSAKHQHPQQPSRDTNSELMVTSGQRKPKVYDCMKVFLKRKLFNQTSESTPKVTAEEEATSDYDEIEVLDSSYNADEEDETDTSSTCSCSKSDIENNTDLNDQMSISPKTVPISCWPNHKGFTEVNSCFTSSSDEEEEKVEAETDAGISDCCQLLKDSSPKRRRSLMKRKRKKKLLTSMKPECSNNIEDDDLLDAAWYQPHLSNKAATERLQHEPPGAFLLRRKTQNFELLLRLETKVRNYSLLDCGKCYKFKHAKKEFSSLRALVTHHSVMAEQLPLTLNLPRPKEQDLFKQSLRYNDDFDSYESLQILGILKRLQAENLELS